MLAVIDCEYTKFAKNIIVKKWGEVFKTLTIAGNEWMNEEGRVVNKIDLKSIAKVWMKFLKSRLMRTTHTTTVSQDRLILLYAIVKGLTIDVGKIVEQEIRECATKKQKSIALLFFSLITGICEVSRVKFEASDERVKNKGTITARIVEKIAMESTAAATPKHLLQLKEGKLQGLRRYCTNSV